MICWQWCAMSSHRTYRALGGNRCLRRHGLGSLRRLPPKANLTIRKRTAGSNTSTGTSAKCLPSTALRQPGSTRSDASARRLAVRSPHPPESLRTCHPHRSHEKMVPGKRTKRVSTKPKTETLHKNNTMESYGTSHVATLVQPEILPIDEMCGTEGAAFQEKAQHRIMYLIHCKFEILRFCSHSPELRKEYCKRVFFLEHGTLREETLC